MERQPNISEQLNLKIQIKCLMFVINIYIHEIYPRLLEEEFQEDSNILYDLTCEELQKLKATIAEQTKGSEQILFQVFEILNLDISHIPLEEFREFLKELLTPYIKNNDDILNNILLNNILMKPDSEDCIRLKKIFVLKKHLELILDLLKTVSNSAIHSVYTRFRLEKVYRQE